jgi:hypothetical protein
MPGHLRGDGDYVMSRQPDYVLLGPASGTWLHMPWFISDIELAKNEEFLACYQQHVRSLPRSDRKTPDHRDVIVWFERTCPKSS